MVIAIINGPNLNMLGKRKPSIYGRETLEELNEYLKKSFPEITLTFFQSNGEGEIIDYIQTLDADGGVINAGGYTHYSVAIRDAIEARSDMPFAETHLSDISEREGFRKVSLLTDVCVGTFMGEGKESYVKAIKFLSEKNK